MALLLSLFLTCMVSAIVMVADPPAFRLPHPLAPSLPQLSDAEEDELDGIIDRFMLFDVGRLPGPAGQQALKQFEALKSDAIPALLRGLARSARLDHDCPVTVIARRLRDLLLRSTDRTLLAFARDEVDSVDLRRHRGIVTDLKVRLTGRLALLDRSNTPEPPLYHDEKLAGLTVADIKKMLANNPDAVTARAVLGELATRKEPEVLEALALGASSPYPEIRAIGRKQLALYLSKRTDNQMSTLLRHDMIEVRRAAALAMLGSRSPLSIEAIALLKDDSAQVRQAVHQELVRQAGKDLAALGDNATSLTKAVTVWTAWWRQR